MTRPSWDQYFLEMCNLIATRATCDRLHVGSVIVKDKRIIATGYNGSIPGLPSCDDPEKYIICNNCKEIIDLTTHKSPSGFVRCNHCSTLVSFTNEMIYYGGHDIENNSCVSGDTVLSKFQKQHYNTGHKTVREIYNMWNSKWIFLAKKIKLRSVNDNGIIVPTYIKDIWSVGIKDSYQVTTKLGKQVKTTIDHKFLTKSGWIPISELKIGDFIALNEHHLYQDYNWLFDQYVNNNKTMTEMANIAGCVISTIKLYLLKHNIPIRNFKFGGWNKGMIRDQSPSYKGIKASKKSARQRSKKYKRRFKEVEYCEVCKEKKEKLHVHHIDKNPYNDTISNLITLCTECHSLMHVSHPKRKCVLYDQIIDIRYIGKEEMFDIYAEPYHNFVGNSILLHNCQRVIHSEVNAVTQAARLGISTEGCTIYCSHMPCWNCFKVIVSSGILEVVYANEYKQDKRILNTVALLQRNKNFIFRKFVP